MFSFGASRGVCGDMSNVMRMSFVELAQMVDATQQIVFSRVRRVELTYTTHGGGGRGV